MQEWMQLEYLGSRTHKADAFQIKSMSPTHICSRDKTNRCLTYDLLANRYLETFRGDLE